MCVCVCVCIRFVGSSWNEYLLKIYSVFQNIPLVLEIALLALIWRSMIIIQLFVLHFKNINTVSVIGNLLW